MKRIYFPLILVSLALTIACNTHKHEPIPLIIDADTANEIDDLYAIVRALKAPELDVIGITSAQFHTSPLASNNSVHESQEINEKIAALMDLENLPMPIGGNLPLVDKVSPQPSDASAFIVDQALLANPDKPLHITILGSCTNVASAVLENPAIIPNIHVHYIGFWHDTAKGVFDKVEFNSGNDTNAVNVLLNADGLMFDVMTATTCQNLVFSREEAFRQLDGQGKIQDYLVQRWKTYKRWWTEEDPEQLEWIMWDVAIIEALIHPKWATLETFNTPPENTERTIRAYTSIQVDKMKKDFFESLAQP